MAAQNYVAISPTPAPTVSYTPPQPTPPTEQQRGGVELLENDHGADMGGELLDYGFHALAARFQ